LLIKQLGILVLVGALILGLHSTCFAQKKGDGPSISGRKAGTMSATSHTGRSKVLRLPKYDRQLLHFGFLLGVNYSSFSVRYEKDLVQFDSVYTIQQQPQPGFDLGIISDLRLGNHFNLRFTPTLQFVERKLNFSLNGRKDSTYIVTKPITSYLMNFPLCVKFKSERINNWRAYLVGGGRFGVDMGSNSKVKDKKKDKDLIKLNRFDYGVEIGVGFDFYLDFFKLSPEIKMVYGLNNVLVKDGGVYSNPISRLNSKMFVFSLNFE
jgi:hypothetical protein